VHTVQVVPNAAKGIAIINNIKTGRPMGRQTVVGLFLIIKASPFLFNQS
jgi:hypothetical protein